LCQKYWTLNATAAAREKFDGGVTSQSTTSTPWKFGLVSRRNSTAPRCNGQSRQTPRWCPSKPDTTEYGPTVKLNMVSAIIWLEACLRLTSHYLYSLNPLGYKNTGD